MNNILKITIKILTGPFEEKLSIFLVFLQFLSVILLNGSLQDLVFTLLLLYTNTCFEVLQNCRTENEVSKFNEFMVVKSKKLHDNKLILTTAIDIGDIIHLGAGDKVPSNCVLIEQSIYKSSNFLRINESVITGESKGIVKYCSDITLSDAFLFAKTCRNHSNLDDKLNPEDMHKVRSINMCIQEYRKCKNKHILGGTFVLQGTGLALVIDKSNAVLDIQTNLTTIQSQLTNEVGRVQSILFIVILTVCAFLFVYCFFRMDIEALKICISLAITAIPEGLELIVKLNLCMIIFRLKKRRIFIKKLISLETLGRVNMVIFDKTGTITTNEQSIDKFIILSKKGESVAQHLYNLEKKTRNDGVCFENNETDEHDLFLSTCKHLNDLIIVNNKLVGDPLDVSMSKIEMDCKSKLLFFKSFCNVNMIARGIVELDGKYYEIVKGAPECVMDICGTFGIQINGKHETITVENRKKILSSFKQRTIACAYRKLTAEQNVLIRQGDATTNTLLNDDQLKDRCYTLLGFITFKDMLKIGVKECFFWCKKNNIKLCILTGDSKSTTKALISDFDANSCYYSAKRFIRNHVNSNMLDRTQKPEAKKNKNVYSDLNHPVHIIYRASPSDKHAIVKHFGLTHTTLMVGDGINDLLAIKQADIGVSLGEGTDLSKEISDIILTDSNISSILFLIMSGKTALHNVKALLKYLISSNVGEVIAVFLAIISNKQALNPKQLLFVNLLTDGLPATLLCFNTGHHSCGLLMIRSAAIAFYLGIGSYLIDNAAKSFLFIVIGEMFNSLNNINLGVSLLVSYRENRYLVVAVLFTILSLFMMTRSDIFFGVLNIRNVLPSEFLSIIVYAFPIVLIDEIFKQFG